MSNMNEERRKRRMRRLLQNPDERMNKICGIKPHNNESSITEPETNKEQDKQVEYTNYQSQPLSSASVEKNAPEPPSESVNSFVHTENYIRSTSNLKQERRSVDNTSPQDFKPIPKLVEEIFSAKENNAQTEDIGQRASEGQEILDTMFGKTEEKINEKPEDKWFLKMRIMLCLCAGILVRVSFATYFGAEFVQTIIYPFVALEIAIQGYINAAQLNFSESKGGIFLTLLVLSGVPPSLRNSYQYMVTVITFMLDDFANYFFSFVLTHLFYIYIAV